MEFKKKMELYNFVCDGMFLREYGWEKNDFLIWIPLNKLEDAMTILIDIFGSDVFEGGYNGNYNCQLQRDLLCLKLNDLNEDLELEDMFPRTEFQ